MNPMVGLKVLKNMRRVWVCILLQFSQIPYRYLVVEKETQGLEILYRLKPKPDGSTRLRYTGFRGELEHLKIETRFIGEV